ncbi:hypothetical protein Tco_0984365 [Tanacetum coccineum]
MPLQQTFKSSMTWLRPHHTRLRGHDEVRANIQSRHLEQTSRADLRSRPSKGGRDEGAATTSKADGPPMELPEVACDSKSPPEHLDKGSSLDSAAKLARAKTKEMLWRS